MLNVYSNYSFENIKSTFTLQELKKKLFKHLVINKAFIKFKQEVPYEFMN